MGIEPTVIFRGSTGLNTVLDPARIPFNAETGISALAVALNVKVDQTGRVSRRDGYAQIRPGKIHSLFCAGKSCVFMRDSSLYELLPDKSEVLLHTNIHSKLDYAQVNSDIYYTGIADFGIIRNQERVPWSSPPRVGQNSNRQMSPPPVQATHIAFWGGRIFLSLGNFIIYSEPFGFGWFDLARSYQGFDSYITMLKAVDEGLFISTMSAVYFMTGSTPKDFKVKQVSQEPALEWSVAIDLIDGREIGKQIPGLYALWVSPKGASAGGPDGQVYNDITRDSVVYPKTAPVGASLLRGYEFIHTLGV